MSNKRVKFLVISASYPYRGGISDSTHSLCNELIKNKINTEVWTFSLLYPSLIFPGKTQYSNQKYEQKFIIRRVINTINPLNWIRTSIRINKLNPEFLILRYWSPILCIPYFIIGLFLNKKIKVIGLIDNWDNHEKIPLEGLLRMLLVKVCNSFITFSDNIGDQLRASTKKKVLSLFHPINLNLPEIKNKKSAKKDLGLTNSNYVSFIGLIRKYKGLGVLINSFKYLKNENVKLIIAGEFYEPIDKYLNIIKELNLSEKIIIDNNFLDSKKIRDYMCASEIVIQPYIKASQSGITPVAYFYETPLIVSNIKGLREIVERDNSGEVFNKTSENLSKVILNSLKNNNQETYRDNIKKSKSKYTWSRFIQEIEKV
ncbi:MAG: glycosyltransferase [Flavobacteriaceae bacterium]|nr:glycosyltransferase [Flavobacteriaceae bacterium]